MRSCLRACNLWVAWSRPLHRTLGAHATRRSAGAGWSVRPHRNCVCSYVNEPWRCGRFIGSEWTCFSRIDIRFDRRDRFDHHTYRRSSSSLSLASSNTTDFIHRSRAQHCTASRLWRRAFAVRPPRVWFRCTEHVRSSSTCSVCVHASAELAAPFSSRVQCVCLYVPARIDIDTFVALCGEQFAGACASLNEARAAKWLCANASMRRRSKTWQSHSAQWHRQPKGLR